MVEPAPWWGVPVVAGAFLLIGGLLTFLFNFALDRARARRESRQRWDGALLEAGAELLQTAQAIAIGGEKWLFDLSEHEGPNGEPKWVETTFDHTMAAYWRLRVHRPQLMTHIQILGSYPIRLHQADLAQALLMAAISEHLEREQRGNFIGYTDRYMDADERFRTSLRAQLGIEEERIGWIERHTTVAWNNWRWGKRHPSGIETIELRDPERD